MTSINDETNRLQQELRSAFAELNRLGERLENQTRFTDVIERKLREALQSDNCGAETVEIADPIPSLNDGAGAPTAPTRDEPKSRSAISCSRRNPVETDDSWWPRNGPTPRPLVPNAGWWNYSLHGRISNVVGISVCGFGREALERVIEMVAAQQTVRRDFVPLFLTDSTDFDLFRKHGFVFEYLPGPAKQARCGGAKEWHEYAAERRALLERKWGLARVISFGPAEFGKPLPAHGEAHPSLASSANAGLTGEQPPTSFAVPDTAEPAVSFSSLASTSGAERSARRGAVERTSHSPVKVASPALKDSVGKPGRRSSAANNGSSRRRNRQRKVGSDPREAPPC